MGKRVLFYSSVSSVDFFKIQLFYRNDIHVLSSLGYDVIVTNKIVDFLKFRSYDLSFIYFYRLGFFPALLSFIFRKPVFFTGGIDDLDRDTVGFFKWLVQAFLFTLCWFLSTSCFVVSNSDYKNITNFLWSKKKLILSFHSIDFSCDPEPLDFDNNGPLNFVSVCWMGSVGNVVRKGLPQSLALFKTIRNTKKFSNSKFYIIGYKGEGYGYIKKIVDELKLNDSVVFIGPVSDYEKQLVFSKSHFLFQLSLYEGFGLAVLEAINAGLWVIHSNKGGLSDTIGSDGLIFNEEVSLDSFCNKIKFIDKRFSGLKILEKFSHSNRVRDFKLGGL